MYTITKSNELIGVHICDALVLQIGVSMSELSWTILGILLVLYVGRLK